MPSGGVLLADQDPCYTQRALNALCAALEVYHAEDPERWFAEWR